jgi:hypothetical protein
MAARDKFLLSFKLSPLANGWKAKYGKMMVLLRLSVDIRLRFAPPKMLSFVSHFACLRPLGETANLYHHQNIDMREKYGRSINGATTILERLASRF